MLLNKVDIGVTYKTGNDVHSLKLCTSLPAVTGEPVAIRPNLYLAKPQDSGLCFSLGTGNAGFSRCYLPCRRDREGSGVCPVTVCFRRVSGVGGSPLISACICSHWQYRRTIADGMWGKMELVHVILTRPRASQVASCHQKKSILANCGRGSGRPVWRSLERDV